MTMSRLLREYVRTVLQEQTVRVSVDQEKTAQGRKKYGGQFVVGTFESPIKLYRILDGEELRAIASSGRITGGYYSIASEQAYGAAWGADRSEVVEWGNDQRGGRLGHELFLAEIEGQGRTFGHHHYPNMPDDGEVPTTMCSTGAGCALEVGVDDVVSWHEVGEDGSVQPVSYEELGQREALGEKPREQDIWFGTVIRAGKKLAAALTSQLERKGTLRTDPKALLKKACSDGCFTWWAGGEAPPGDVEAASSRGNGRTTFGLLFRAKANVAAPQYHVMPKEAKLIQIFLYDPKTDRKEQIWADIDGVPFKLDSGTPEF